MRRPERVWLLNVATPREAVLPEASRGLEGPLPGGMQKSASLDNPPDPAVGPAACANVDLWVEPQIINHLFVSALLHRAIADARRKARSWHWSPCRAG